MNMDRVHTHSAHGYIALARNHGNLPDGRSSAMRGSLG